MNQGTPMHRPYCQPASVMQATGLRVVKCADGQPVGYFKVGQVIATFDQTVESTRRAWDELMGLGVRSTWRPVLHEGPWHDAPVIGEFGEPRAAVAKDWRRAWYDTN